MRPLNFHHLYYFWVVAKEGHLTRAAEQNHVSQSALSSQIRQLEEQLGQALFIRDGKKLLLTEVGTVVLNYAEGIFALGNELVATVSGGQEQALRVLRVGAVATLSRNFQENLLRPIFTMDNVLLVLESGSLDELLARLGVHKIDIVLSNSPVVAQAQQRWQSRRIAQQDVCLVGPPRNSRKKFRFPQDLVDLKLLVPGATSDIRTQFDLLCERLKISPRIYAEVEDMAMLRLLARDTGGVAVVPEIVVQDELHYGLLEKYCVVPQVKESFYAITVKRHLPSALLETLLGRA
jgi:LysR family transcriptional activator of nhaA